MASPLPQSRCPIRSFDHAECIDSLFDDNNADRNDGGDGGDGNGNDNDNDDGSHHGKANDDQSSSVVGSSKKAFVDAPECPSSLSNTSISNIKTLESKNSSKILQSSAGASGKGIGNVQNTLAALLNDTYNDFKGKRSIFNTSTRLHNESTFGTNIGQSQEDSKTRWKMGSEMKSFEDENYIKPLTSTFCSTPEFPMSNAPMKYKELDFDNHSSKDEQSNHASGHLILLKDSKDLINAKAGSENSLDLLEGKKGTNAEGISFGGYQPSFLSISKSGRRRSMSFFSEPKDFSNSGERCWSRNSDYEKLESRDDVKILRGHRNIFDEGLPIPSVSTTPESLERTRSLQHATIHGYHQQLQLGRDHHTEKDSLEWERKAMGLEMNQLKDENLQLKEELHKVEKEKSEFHDACTKKDVHMETGLTKQICEQVQEIKRDILLEISNLKKNSLLAEEKLASAQRLHDQEVEMLRKAHVEELKARDKQLQIERAFLTDLNHTLENLSKSPINSDKWPENNQQNGETSLPEEHYSSKENFEKLEKVVALLEKCVKDIVACHADENNRFQKYQEHLQSLQEMLHAERRQFLVDYCKVKEKIEDIQNTCLKEKDDIKKRHMEERKNLEVEREEMLQMKEYVMQTDAVLQKQIHKQSSRMRKETDEIVREQSKLNQGRSIGNQAVLAVEDEHNPFDTEKSSFEKDVAASLRNFGIQEKNPKPGIFLECDEKQSNLGRNNGMDCLSKPAQIIAKLSSSRNLLEGVPNSSDLNLNFELQKSIIKRSEFLEYSKGQECFLIKAYNALHDVTFEGKLLGKSISRRNYLSEPLYY